MSGTRTPGPEETTLGAIMAEANRPKPGEAPKVGTSPLYPNTPDVTLDLPERTTGQKPAAQEPAKPAPAKDTSAALFPAMDVTRDLPGDPAPAPEAPPAGDGQQGEITEAEMVRLETQYPLRTPPDWVTDRPAMAGFRRLAAQHGVQPAVVQAMFDQHVTELRRLVREPDPREVARSLYPNTPGVTE
jgi:hypothetical protein